MKARSKSEIAMAMGISEKTLRRWLVQHRQMLGSMGVNPNARLLPPKAVRYICEELGIIEGKRLRDDALPPAIIFY